MNAIESASAGNVIGTAVAGKHFAFTNSLVTVRAVAYSEVLRRLQAVRMAKGLSLFEQRGLQWIPVARL